MGALLGMVMGAGLGSGIGVAVFTIAVPPPPVLHANLDPTCAYAKSCLDMPPWNAWIDAGCKNGMDPRGILDSSCALQAAVVAAGTHGLNVPAGNFKINSAVLSHVHSMNGASMKQSLASSAAPALKDKTCHPTLASGSRHTMPHWSRIPIRPWIRPAPLWFELSTKSTRWLNQSS